MNRRRVERAPRILIEDLLECADILAIVMLEDDRGHASPAARVGLWLLAQAEARELENETRRQVNADRKARRGILA